MKWKLYQICCLYNVLASGIYFCFLNFLFLQGGEHFGWMMLVSGMLLSIMFKNWLSYTLLMKLKNNEAPAEHFSIRFYFLWILNILIYLIYLIILYVVTLTVAKAEMNYVSLLYIIAVVSIYIGGFTLLYTICLDIPLDKKVLMTEVHLIYSPTTIKT